MTDYNLYAIDGLCHNANFGTYGHECGRPAEWIGTMSNGFRSGFCAQCKQHGDEGRHVVSWEPRPLGVREDSPQVDQERDIRKFCG